MDRRKRLRPDPSPTQLFPLLLLVAVAVSLASALAPSRAAAGVYSVDVCRSGAPAAGFRFFHSPPGAGSPFGNEERCSGLAGDIRLVTDTAATGTNYENESEWE